MDNADDSLSGGDQPLVQQLKSIQHQLDALCEISLRSIGDIVKRLHSAQIEVKDIADDIETINDEVVYDPATIEKLE